jgi:hypothetical protein
MMARSSKAPSIGRIQKRKTNFSKSSLSACNARPVHTDGPLPEVSSPLFHDVVGEREEFIWNGEAERLGGLEVDDEIKFGRLLDRQLARLRPA